MDLKNISAKIAEHLRKAFSDNGEPSSSRLLALVHSVVASFVLVYIAIKTHGWPDGGTSAGLGAFATAPYAVNRASKMFDKKDDSKDTKDVPSGPVPRGE
ncbi:Uncharacterised protein [uncultured archaeon]|nr:Uncharacterised protein [uncultured archaeon]